MAKLRSTTPNDLTKNPSWEPEGLAHHSVQCLNKFKTALTLSSKKNKNIKRSFLLNMCDHENLKTISMTNENLQNLSIQDIINSGSNI